MITYIPKTGVNAAGQRAVSIKDLLGVLNEIATLEGGTMTGPLILYGPPTEPLEAATKGYVDAADTAERERAMAAEALLAPIDAPVFSTSVTLPEGVPLILGDENHYLATQNDGADFANTNIIVRSWDGIGIGTSCPGQTVPIGLNTAWFDTRTGNASFYGQVQFGGKSAYLGACRLNNVGANVLFDTGGYYAALSSTTPAAGGSGVVLNDCFYDAYNNTYTATAVASGAVTTIRMDGSFPTFGTPPANPVSLTAIGGVGTGVRVNLTWTRATTLTLNPTGTTAIGNAAISGGTINATPIGTTTPAAGAFTNLSATSLALAALNGTSIGAITPSTGAFTTLSASGTVSGAGFTALLAPYALTTALPGAATVAPLIDGTAAVGTSALYARQDHVHPTDTSRAPVASPTFSGVPAGPTAGLGTSTTQLATTAFVAAAITAGTAGVASFNTRTGAVTLTSTDVTTALTFTPYNATNPSGYQTAAQVTAALPVASATTPLIDGTATAGVATAWSRGDHVHPTDTSRYAASNPSGYQTAAQVATTLTAPGPIGSVTPSTGAFTTLSASSLTLAALNGTSIGTTTPSTGAFTTLSASGTVSGAGFTALLAPYALTTALPGAATVAPLIDGTAAVGTSALYARQDHVHPTDTTRAPLASPALTGTPTVPTASVSTNTTQAASTAFVLGQAATATPLINGTAAVGTSLLYARQDHVHPTDTTRAPVNAAHLTGMTMIDGATLGSVLINSTQPDFRLYDSSGGADAHYTSITHYTGSLNFRFVNDAYTAANNFMSASRSGYAITGLTFNSGSGAATFSGTLAAASQVVAGSSGNGSASLVTGGASNTGLCAFYDAAGTRLGYAGFGSDGGTLMLTAENGTTGWTTTGNHFATGQIAAGWGGTGGYMCKNGETNGAFGSNVFNLFWNGSATVLWIDDYNAGFISVSSDGRYKHHVESLPDTALARVNRLRPVSYRWRDKGIVRDDGRTREGLIAQEVKKVIPAAVEGDDTLSLSPLPLIAVLIKAVQELSAKVEALKPKAA